VQATLDDVYQFYITPDDYEAAAQNGVSRKRLETRIRRLAWDKSRAINTPPQVKKRIPKEIVELAKQNGICYGTLKCRVNRHGWDLQRAATEPLRDKQAGIKVAQEKRRKYPPELIDIARENGIQRSTFYKRVGNGWDLETAATRPLTKPEEMGRKWRKFKFKF
jgi:hypothetical protein